MVEVVKSAFASRLADCLRRAYKGHLPSIVVIARDFSLRSPHLPHVSGETVRKWLRGENLPHVSRMQVLIDWLGPEIAAPFEQHSQALQHLKSSSEAAQDRTGQVNDTSELLAVARSLTEKEYQSVLSIAQLLAQRGLAPQQPHQPSASMGLDGDGHFYEPEPST